MYPQYLYVMKRMQPFLICLFFIFLLSFSANSKDKPKEYYQIIVYHFTSAGQEAVIDTYLKNAFLPALHRKGISTIGVFKPVVNDTATDKRIYVLFPAKKIEQLISLPKQLSKDKEYLQAGEAYLNSTYSAPPYARMENILLEAFEMAPTMVLPNLKGANTEKVYELRSYESATEKIFSNKVKMFTEGKEINIFKKLRFNAIFYATVIAGCHMPNLMYMTSFENMNQREEHWKTFSADSDWKKLSSEDQYQHNVFRADIILMHAAPYSDY